MASSTPGTIIGCWSLAKSSATPAESTCVFGPLERAAESTLIIGPRKDAFETVLADDSRTKVDPRDILPGGKYRSIVKLQIRFEKQSSSDKRWAQGTGWLIKPNLLVTAGHCAFDHTYKFGKATQIRAYVGYNGKDSINQPGVQFRNGIKIATPEEWIKSDVNRANDISFIEVDQAFSDIKPIVYAPTPSLVDGLRLGVVGYPADKTYKDESGAQMYEMYKDTTCDLSKTNSNMLEYTISSFAGQSGSPVLIQGENRSIGANVHGDGAKCSASVVRGPYGNYFNGLASVIQNSDNVATADNSIVYFQIQEDSEAALGEVRADGFFDMIHDVVKVVPKLRATIRDHGPPSGLSSPLLG